ncbi:MAG: FliM/FliN family flagellar motor switch protein [Acidobacteria bacterium]|nr:FliM/FliN family flagellar motor switch protein [Acidobacteriota bacterium]
MKTDANTLREEEVEPAPAVDPFAVDLFAGGKAVAAAGRAGRASSAETPRAVSWDAALPKVSRDEARLSALLAAVPAPLSTAARAALARVAARFTRTDEGQVAFDFLETREEELETRDVPRAYVSFAVEPWEARAVLVVESAFVSAVVDLLLGGDGATSADAPRPLSTAERAVFEFLCAQLLAALNEEAGEPLFRLEALTEDAPASSVGRAVVTKVRARFGQTAGVVRLVYGREVLAALDEMRSPLLARGASDAGAERLARYRKLCAGAEVSLLVGETEVDPASLAGLEPGDVVLFERVFGEWGPGSARGTLRARVGADDNVLVVGSAGRTDGVEDSDGGALRLLVEEVSASAARGGADAWRLRMEDESELTEESGAEAGLLDNLLLTVRVELPARRISLEELTRLRAGQILELDCRATDPVELVADGRRVATGELVDIEGRLGVRVTRLAG